LSRALSTQGQITEGTRNKVIGFNSDIALPSLRTKEEVSPEDWDKLNARVSRQDNVGTGT